MISSGVLFFGKSVLFFLGKSYLKKEQTFSIFSQDWSCTGPQDAAYSSKITVSSPQNTKTTDSGVRAEEKFKKPKSVIFLGNIPIHFSGFIFSINRSRGKT